MRKRISFQPSAWDLEAERGAGKQSACKSRSRGSFSTGSEVISPSQENEGASSVLRGERTDHPCATIAVTKCNCKSAPELEHSTAQPDYYRDGSSPDARNKT